MERLGKYAMTKTTMLTNIIRPAALFALAAGMAGTCYPQNFTPVAGAAKAPAMLTPLAPEATSPRHSYVLAQGGESFLYNPSAGIENAPFLHGVYKAFGFSYDSRYFLYLKSKGGLPTFSLYRYDLAAGTEERVVGETVYNAAWSPASLEIAYFALDSAMQARLAVYDPATGTSEPVDAGMLDPDYLEWSPDGSSLLYRAFSALTPNLFHDQQVASELRQYDVKGKSSAKAAAAGLGRFTPAGLVSRSSVAPSPDGSADSMRNFVYSGGQVYATFGDGQSTVVKAMDPDTGGFSDVAPGEIHRVIDEGIVVRQFTPEGVRFSFVSNTSSSAAPAGAFSGSWLMPVQGSAYLVQGGSLFAGGACDGRACLVVSHKLTLGYALDWQQTPEDGQGNKHVLASEEGTVVATYNTVTCNSNTLNAGACTSSIDPYSSACNDPNFGAGNYVIIAHADGSFTMYGHLRSGSVQVTPNQFVTRGTYLADQGHSGVAGSVTGYNGCGDHLHFQRQVNAQIWGQSVATDFQELPCALSCLSAFVSQNVENNNSPEASLTVALAPSSVAAGSVTYGNTVNLASVAPSGGAVVALSSSNPVLATVPASVTVPAGSASASFSITTSASGGAGQTIVSANYSGSSSTATLNVTGVSASLLALSQTTVVGGNAPAGNEVDLSGAAPAGGATVSLTSSNPAVAAVPATLLIPAGATFSLFNVTTAAVSAATQVTITASYGSGTVTAVLTVTPATLSVVSLSPNVIYGGYPTTGTVTFTGAVAADTPVSLVSSDPSVTLPASVTVPANSVSVQFALTSSPGTSTIFPVITASASGISKTATLTVKPIALSSLTLYPSSVGGGIPTSSNRVTLNFAAVSDALVLLASSDPSVTVPATVTVPAGSTTSNMFTIGTSAVTSPLSVQITATYNGSSKTATLSVTPITLSTLTLSPTSVIGGLPAAYNTLRLNSAAPPGGAVVTVTSSDPSAIPPASVTVAAGGTLSPSFTINTNLVTVATSVTITASYGGVTQSGALTVNPILVSAVNLNPTSAGGGNSTTLNRVVLNSPAPAGGATVTLASSDPSVTAPASVFISAGNTNSAPFTISTSSVAASISVTISATYNNVTQSSVLSVNPIQASGVVLTPTTLGGGATSTANTVSLNYPAPPGGAVVTLTSSDPSAKVPATVTIAAGSPSATFSVQSTPVASPVAVTITASYGGATQTAGLTVSPPALATLSLVPATVGGGNTTTGNVLTLNGPAAASGAAVTVSSSNPALASTPATVTIGPGGVSAAFSIATAGVASVTTVTITASFGGVTQNAVLTLNPPALSSLALVPAGVGGGNSTAGNTVTLTAPALAGGAVVSLGTSNASVASAPPTVTVPQGAISAPFTISTSQVPSSTAVTITASFGGVTQPATLTVAPILVANMSISPVVLTGGASASGSVALNVAAPPAGVVVALTSSDPSVSVPASVTVAGGSTVSPTFALTTSPVASATPVTVTAAYNGSSQAVGMTVNPPLVALLKLSPTSVGGGNSTTGNYVTLSAPAPAGGAVVVLGSSSPAAIPPASVTVPAGATTSATFTINTTSVSVAVAPLISASFAGSSKSANLSVNPIVPSGVTLYPTSVGGGNSTTLNRVTLNYPAPPGGLTVSLASSDPAAAVPATLTIPAGANTSPYFTVTTSAVTSVISAVITASYGGVTKPATLTISPIVLSAITVSPSSVTGGTSARANTVRISSAAPPGGAVVTLTSSNPAVAAVPASVTVPAGGTASPNFTITTTAVASQTPVTITATYGGVTLTGTLTVN